MFILPSFVNFTFAELKFCRWGWRKGSKKLKMSTLSRIFSS